MDTRKTVNVKNATGKGFGGVGSARVAAQTVGVPPLKAGPPPAKK